MFKKIGEGVCIICILVISGYWWMHDDLTKLQLFKDTWYLTVCGLLAAVVGNYAEGIAQGVKEDGKIDKITIDGKTFDVSGDYKLPRNTHERR